MKKSRAEAVQSVIFAESFSEKATFFASLCDLFAVGG
jgi:hypothetical protein